MRVLITAALPYANGPLHFGHIAGAYLPADCYARFQRLIGNEVLYICGSDEHGVAITLSAECAGRTPQEHVDDFHQILKDFFDQMRISFDHYSRTTWEGHVEPSQTFFKQLFKNGYIEEKITDQLYSEREERFFADRYVSGTCPKCQFEKARGDECPQCGASYEATELLFPKSKRTGDPLVLRKTKHWFLRFDLFKEKLSHWVQEKKWKPNVLHFVQNYIEALRPRAITRDSDWGIPVPLEEGRGKVLYVWFEAPIGYISATKQWAEKTGDPDGWKKYWCDPKTRLVQFIGKDNIPFHAIFFPAMIMGQDVPYKLVDELPANEFYHLEGKQFSKSDGWYIDLNAFFSDFTADQIRYAIAANAPETQDSSFSWKDFQMRCNSELLGKYGNFVHRVLVFVQNQCAGNPPPCLSFESIDRQFIEEIEALTGEVHKAYSQFHLRRAAQLIMEIAQRGNQYFDAKKPWKDPKGSGATLACALRALQALAFISFPIMPQTGEALWKLVGNETQLRDQKWETSLMELPLSSKTPLPKPSVLFTKVEDAILEKHFKALRDLLKRDKA